MRNFPLPVRIPALTVVLFALFAALSPPAFAVTDPALKPMPGAKVMAVGGTYDVSTGFRLACSDDAGPNGCSTVVTLTGVVNVPGQFARLVVIGRSLDEVGTGDSKRVVVRLNKAGADELRRAGRFRATLRVQATASANQGAGSTSSTMNFARTQVITAPSLVVTRTSKPRIATLAPGQRLIVRLHGESASAGTSWRVTAASPTSVLRRVSNRSVAAPGCADGMVGCPSTRVVVFVARSMGVATVSATLHGPDRHAAPLARFAQRVATNGVARPLPRVLTATANGTTIGLKFMERLTVRLTGASASTGYSWKVITTETSWLKPYAHEVLLNDCGGTAAGCGQVDEFSYDPTGSDGALEIGLFAPGASTPAERFKLAYVAPVPIALPGA